MAKLKRKQVEDKLREFRGNVSATATAFGVGRNVLYSAIERWHLGPVVEEARDTMVDMAETALMRAVIAGDAWAVCFTLKTQGKRRGYVERTEHEISGRNGEPIQITAVDYRKAIVNLAPIEGGSVGDSDTPGED